MNKYHSSFSSGGSGVLVGPADGAPDQPGAPLAGPAGAPLLPLLPLLCYFIQSCSLPYAIVFNLACYFINHSTFITFLKNPIFEK